MEPRQGNISLILEGYNDLFSDFDPRGYHERGISDDFLFECRRAVRDRGDSATLTLLMPAEKRKPEDETVIKRRLREHFQHHYTQLEAEIRENKRRGMLWVLVGMAFMLAGIFLYGREGLLYTILIVFFEPAGWFTFWTGLDTIFFGDKEKRQEDAFYRRMTKLQVSFESYKKGA